MDILIVSQLSRSCLITKTAALQATAASSVFGIRAVLAFVLAFLGFSARESLVSTRSCSSAFPKNGLLLLVFQSHIDHLAGEVRANHGENALSDCLGSEE